jgi:hypothetical protein
MDQYLGFLTGRHAPEGVGVNCTDEPPGGTLPHEKGE